MRRRHLRAATRRGPAPDPYGLAVLCALALAGLAGPATAQEPAAPQTDIYLAALSLFDGLYYLGDLRNITNRPEAYDNQPFFTPDGRSILYTAAHEDGSDGQTEIHRYYIASMRVTRITRTAESEYSPTPIPGDRAFSAVRVEADSTQRLWRFTMEGMNAEPVLRDVAPVGYHAWGNENDVLLFVLGDPPTLQVADVATGVAEAVALGPGPSLHKIPNRNAWSFVERSVDGESWVSELNVGTHEIVRLIRAPDASDFHAWTPEGVLLAASGGRILQWDPELDEDWQLVADLTHMDVSFSRIAVSADGARLAVVGVAIR